MTIRHETGKVLVPLFSTKVLLLQPLTPHTQHSVNII